MKSILRFFLCMIFLLSFPLSVSADFLHVIHVGVGGPMPDVDPTNPDARFAFDVGGVVYDDIYGGTVFDLFLSPADVGSAFIVSSGAEFEEAAAYLTNGIDDFFSFRFEAGGGGSTEATGIFGDYTGAHGIDFAGSQIHSFALTIDRLDFTEMEGGWRDYNFAGRVFILGISPVPIPEPETSALMMAGLAGLGLVSRKRRKSASN